MRVVYYGRDLYHSSTGQQRDNHQYIARIPIGDKFRYFYSQAELAAYNAGKNIRGAADTVGKAADRAVNNIKNFAATNFGTTKGKNANMHSYNQGVVNGKSNSPKHNPRIPINENKQRLNSERAQGVVNGKSNSPKHNPRIPINENKQRLNSERANNNAPKYNQGIVSKSNAPKNNQGVVIGSLKDSKAFKSNAPKNNQGIVSKSNAPKNNQGIASTKLERLQRDFDKANKEHLTTLKDPFAYKANTALSKLIAEERKVKEESERKAHNNAPKRNQGVVNGKTTSQIGKESFKRATDDLKNSVPKSNSVNLMANGHAKNHSIVNTKGKNNAPKNNQGIVNTKGKNNAPKNNQGTVNTKGKNNAPKNNQGINGRSTIDKVREELKNASPEQLEFLREMIRAQHRGGYNK